MVLEMSTSTAAVTHLCREYGIVNLNSNFKEVKEREYKAVSPSGPLTNKKVFFLILSHSKLYTFPLNADISVGG